jgi:predicted transcriptional regulator
MKGEVVRLILQTIDENSNNVYDSLEGKGYSRLKAWSYLPRLVKLGYLVRKAKAQYVLSEKGRRHLNNLVFGAGPCPYCGSYKTKRNGKRNGAQRFACSECGFCWTENYKTQALIRALKRQGKSIFILACNPRFSYLVLNSLREWLKSDDDLDRLSRTKLLNLIVP